MRATMLAAVLTASCGDAACPDAASNDVGKPSSIGPAEPGEGLLPTMTYSPTGNTGRSCYWRNIQSRSELDPKTIGSESLRGRFFDPKIPGNVDSVDLREISFADFNGPRTWRLNLHSWRFLDFWLHSPQSSAEHVVDLVEILTKYDDEVWRSGELRQSIEFVESDISVAARAAGLAFALCVDNELSISTADQRRTMEKMLQWPAPIRWSTCCVRAWRLGSPIWVDRNGV